MQHHASTICLQVQCGTRSIYGAVSETGCSQSGFWFQHLRRCGMVLSMTEDQESTASPRYEVSRVPKWSMLNRVKLPEAEAGFGDRRYSAKSDPLLIFQTLLATLWFDLGARQRASLYEWSTPQSSFSRNLRAWTTPEGNQTLRDAWRSYMDLLTEGQQQVWLEKLMVQADSWRDWDKASRLAGRVHSLWFQIILQETKRAAK